MRRGNDGGRLTPRPVTVSLCMQCGIIQCAFSNAPARIVVVDWDVAPDDEHPTIETIYETDGSTPPRRKRTRIAVADYLADDEMGMDPMLRRSVWRILKRRQA